MILESFDSARKIFATAIIEARNEAGHDPHRLEKGKKNRLGTALKRRKKTNRQAGESA